MEFNFLQVGPITLLVCNVKAEVLDFSPNFVEDSWLFQLFIPHKNKRFSYCKIDICVGSFWEFVLFLLALSYSPKIFLQINIVDYLVDKNDKEPDISKTLETVVVVGNSYMNMKIIIEDGNLFNIMKFIFKKACIFSLIQNWLR